MRKIRREVDNFGEAWRNARHRSTWHAGMWCDAKEFDISLGRDKLPPPRPPAQLMRHLSPSPSPPLRGTSPKYIKTKPSLSVEMVVSGRQCLSGGFASVER